MPINPLVTEKTLIDIDFSHGMDESMAEEIVDWTKAPILLENVVIEDGIAKVRPGTRELANSFYNGTTFGQLYRLGALDDGLAIIGTPSTGNQVSLYQQIDTNTSFTPKDKGLFPEFSVTRDTVGTDSGYIQTSSSAGVGGVAVTSNYRCICYQGAGQSAASLINIDVVDRYSNNLVASYKYEFNNNPTIETRATIVCVDSRYVHIYLSFAGGITKPKFIQLDLNDPLPASLAAPVDLPTSTVNMYVSAVVAESGQSVWTMSDGGTTATSNYIGKATVGGGPQAPTAITAGRITGLYAANSSYYLGIISATPTWLINTYNSAFAITASLPMTAGGPALAISSTDEIRLSVDSTNLYAVVYRAISVPGTALANRISVASTWQKTLPASGADSLVLMGHMTHVQEACLPFFFSASNKHYVGVTTRYATDYFPGDPDSTDPDTSHTVGNNTVLVDITSALTVTGPTFSSRPAKLRPVAILDQYTPDGSKLGAREDNGAIMDGKAQGCRPQIVTTSGVDHVFIGLTDINSFQRRSYTIATLKHMDFKVNTFSSDVFSGAFTGQFDGQTISPIGFVQSPWFVGIGTGAGSLIAGIRNYVALYEYKNRKGETILSRTSPPITINHGANTSFEYGFNFPTIASWPGDIVISIWATTVGGTQYHLIPNQAGRFASIYPFTGTLLSQLVKTGFISAWTDNELLASPTLHRQPGTQGTALDRYHAVSSNHIVRHKDRVFYCHGNNVYYSSFFVDFEAPWFNPALGFNVPGGTGLITGLASMDGTVVIFKQNAVFLVDGDGPPENGGTGYEFSPPRKIQTEYGCVDPRSIVNVPDGIMYRSSRGIELLTRNFKIVWIGQRIGKTVDSYPYCVGSTFDRVNSRVLFVLGTTKAKGSSLSISSTGATIAYHINDDAWTVFKHLMPPGGTTGTGMQDVCFAQSSGEAVGGLTTQGDFVYYIGPDYLQSGGCLFKQSSSVSTGGCDRSLATDLLQFIRVETGWIKGPTKTDRIRVSDVYITGEAKGFYNITAAYQRDYDKATAATAIGTHTRLVTSGPEKLLWNQPIESLESLKLILTTTKHASGVSTGQQLDIFGLTVNMGVKPGGFKLPATSKA